MPLTRGSLQIDQLTLEAVNFVLQQIQTQLDELKGLSGKVKIEDQIESDGLKHTDSNGTTINGFGNS